MCFRGGRFWGLGRTRTSSERLARKPAIDNPRVAEGEQADDGEVEYDWPINAV
jgi:hypothetical protein